MIPITRVVCGPEEESLVLQVLRSGMLAAGPMVASFEACCREMSGAEHAVAVNNGTRRSSQRVIPHPPLVFAAALWPIRRLAKRTLNTSFTSPFYVIHHGLECA